MCKSWWQIFTRKLSGIMEEYFLLPSFWVQLWFPVHPFTLVAKAKSDLKLPYFLERFDVLEEYLLCQPQKVARGTFMKIHSWWRLAVNSKSQTTTANIFLLRGENLLTEVKTQFNATHSTNVLSKTETTILEAFWLTQSHASFDYSGVKRPQTHTKNTKMQNIQGV